MLLKLFTIFDSKAEAFQQPFSAQSTGAAIRMFSDIAQDQKHPIGQHPEDYTLFEIGTFNPLSAEIKISEAKTSLGTALEHVEIQMLSSHPIYSDPDVGDISKVS